MKHKLLILTPLVLFLFTLGQVSKLRITQIGCLDIKKVIDFVSKNAIVKSSLLGVEKKILEQARSIEENIKFLEKRTKRRRKSKQVKEMKSNRKLLSKKPS